MIVYFSYLYLSRFAHLHNHRMVERREYNSYLVLVAGIMRHSYSSPTALEERSSWAYQFLAFS